MQNLSYLRIIYYSEHYVHTPLHIVKKEAKSITFAFGKEVTKSIPLRLIDEVTPAFALPMRNALQVPVGTPIYIWTFLFFCIVGDRMQKSP